jgi:hypothetical protein
VENVAKDEKTKKKAEFNEGVDKYWNWRKENCTCRLSLSIPSIY